MKKYISNELVLAHKLYENNGCNDLRRTIDELNTIKEDIFKYKNNTIETDILSNVVKVKLNDYTYNIISYIIDLYSKIPQLEIETSTRYPMIRKQIISDEYIYNFTNRVLENESFTKPFTFNKKTLHIFNNNSIFKKSDSRCIVYKNYYLKSATMLLNRYNNVRDLVFPLKKFIQIIEYNDNIEFTNKSLLIEYYMQHKAIQKLINTGSYDAYKLLLTTIDGMVYNARLIKKYITNKNWKNLPANLIFKLLDFTNHAIAIELVNNNISLNELYTYLQDYTNEEYININDLSISKTSINENVNNYVKKYIKKQYL